MIYFVVPRETEFGIREYLELWGKELAGRMRIIHYETLPGCSSLPAGVYIFSALDQLLLEGRRLAGEVWDQLAGAGPGVRCLNSPRDTLLRADLLKELHLRGLNRHTALRATDDLGPLRFPVFLREENRHTGALTGLLHSPAELEAELGRAVVRGLRTEQLLVMEFHDTVGDDGLYRKYAAFLVGNEVIPRGLARGHSWGLKHSAAEFTRELVEEERIFVLSNPHEAQLREIFAAGNVGYGRIDYAVKDGAVETWEINLNPTIGRGLRAPSGVVPAELQVFRQEARDHFYRRFQSAFEAIDLPVRPDARVMIAYRPDTLAALTAMAGPAEFPRRFAAIRRVFRPFHLVLDPLVRKMAPLLVRTSLRKPKLGSP